MASPSCWIRTSCFIWLINQKRQHIAPEEFPIAKFLNLTLKIAEMVLEARPVLFHSPCATQFPPKYCGVCYPRFGSWTGKDQHCVMVGQWEVVSVWWCLVYSSLPLQLSASPLALSTLVASLACCYVVETPKPLEQHSDLRIPRFLADNRTRRGEPKLSMARNTLPHIVSHRKKRDRQWRLLPKNYL